MAQSLSRLHVHVVFATKHRKQSFQDEFRALLTKHGVSFDERYVWD